MPFTWLHQKVLIARAVVTLIVLVVSYILQFVMSLACMFAEGSTALLFALSACIEMSVLTVLSFFIPGGWNALCGKKTARNTSRKQSFVLSAVFIAGRRRVFGRNGDHRLRCEDLYF